MLSHTDASSTESVFYRRGGAYENVNCTNLNQNLSDCEHGILGGVNPRDQCSTGQFAQVECKGMPALGFKASHTHQQRARQILMKFDILLCVHSLSNSYQLFTIIAVIGDPVTTTDTAVATTTFAATTTPPAETTTTLTTDSTTTSFEDSNSTTTTGATTTDPLQATMEPGAPQSQSDSQLLAIVLGAVGGLIAILLFGIIVLLVIVVLGRRRRKYSVQYLDDRYTHLIVCADVAISQEIVWYLLWFIEVTRCVVSLQVRGM